MTRLVVYCLCNSFLILATFSKDDEGNVNMWLMPFVGKQSNVFLSAIMSFANWHVHHDRVTFAFTVGNVTNLGICQMKLVFLHFFKKLVEVHLCKNFLQFISHSKNV